MLERIWTHIFYLVAAAFLALFAYLLYAEHDGQFLSILAALVSLLGARMRDVLKFKFSITGLEAELRGLVDEAKASVQQLHILAVQQSKAFLEGMQMTARWGGFSEARKDEMRTELVSSLKRIGLSQADITEVLRAERPYLLFDYANWVSGDLYSRAPPAGYEAEWREFFSPEKRKGIGYEPTPTELEKFLQAMSLLTGERRERLLDYRHYAETGTHRRSLQWAERMALPPIDS